MTSESATKKKMTTLKIDSEIAVQWRDFCGGKNDSEILGELLKAIAESGLTIDELKEKIGGMTKRIKSYENRKSETLQKIQDYINEYIEMNDKKPTISTLSRMYSINYNVLKEYYEKNPECGIVEAKRGRKPKDN